MELIVRLLLAAMPVSPGARRPRSVTSGPSPAGGYVMMCTAYPDTRGRNKPVTFFSPDGVAWNGSTDNGGFPVTRDQVIAVSGLDAWADADVNGMNVVLCEDGAMGREARKLFDRVQDEFNETVGFDFHHWHLEALDAPDTWVTTGS